jgi:hypothetical protein
LCLLIVLAGRRGAPGRLERGNQRFDEPRRLDTPNRLLIGPPDRIACGAVVSGLRTGHDGALELLRIRFSSSLFRLGSFNLVQQRVSFPTGGPTQTPGVIVMSLDDRAGPDLDPRYEGIVVVFNASNQTTTQTFPALAGAAYRLHLVQNGGGDPVVRTSSYNALTGAFTVPPRTVAVFVTS